MKNNVIQFEDWTHGDPVELDNQRREAEQQERMLADMRKMAREIVRLRRIERAAEQVFMQHAGGNILPQSPMACQSIVDLGRSLLVPAQWRRV